MQYLDTCYLVRLYLEDPGFEAVRTLAAVDSIACAAHGRAAMLAAFHRKMSERAVTPAAYRVLVEQFDLDCAQHAFQWLPLAPAVLDCVRSVFYKLPAKAFLGAGDALHLDCAAEKGFDRIYSNDQRLLESARHFGLRHRCVASCETIGNPHTHAELDQQRSRRHTSRRRAVPSAGS